MGCYYEAYAGLDDQRDNGFVPKMDQIEPYKLVREWNFRTWEADNEKDDVEEWEDHIVLVTTIHFHAPFSSTNGLGTHDTHSHGIGSKWVASNSGNKFGLMVLEILRMQTTFEV